MQQSTDSSISDHQQEAHLSTSRLPPSASKRVSSCTPHRQKWVYDLHDRRSDQLTRSAHR